MCAPMNGPLFHSVFASELSSAFAAQKKSAAWWQGDRECAHCGTRRYDVSVNCRNCGSPEVLPVAAVRHRD